MREFSPAEASPPVGVAPAAPYRRVPDREAFVAAVTVQAHPAIGAVLVSASAGGSTEERLAAMTASFVGSAPDASISAVSTATLTAVRLPRGPSGEEGCSSMLAELRRLQVVSERRWLWSRARTDTPCRLRCPRGLEHRIRHLEAVSRPEWGPGVGRSRPTAPSHAEAAQSGRVAVGAPGSRGDRCRACRRPPW